MGPRFDFNTTYTAVAASQTDAAVSSAPAVGQILERLVVNVTTSATSQVQIKDGNGTAITIVPNNTPIGTYSVIIGAVCRNAISPGWKITTAAGVSVLAIGRF